MSHISVVLVSAGVGSPSTTSMLCARIAKALDEAGVDSRIIELRELASGLSHAVVAGIRNPTVQAALQAVTNADALVMATPIYKGSYSGLFKLFIDLLEQDAIVSRPVLLAATGGTARHSLALDGDMRALFGYLRALVVPTVIFAAPEDWGDSPRAVALSARIRRGAGELLGLARAGTALPAAKVTNETRAQDADPDKPFDIAFDTPLMRLAAGGTADAR